MNPVTDMCRTVSYSDIMPWWIPVVCIVCIIGICLIFLYLFLKYRIKEQKPCKK